MKDNFDTLISSIEEKVKLLKKLNNLTIMQNELILNEDYEKLVLNLADRQIIINKYKIVSEKVKKLIEEFKICLNDDCNTYSNEEKKLKNLEKLEKSLLESIKEAGLKNGVILKSKRDEVKCEIKKLNDNKKGLSAYGRINAHNGSLYFDKINKG